MYKFSIGFFPTHFSFQNVKTTTAKAKYLYICTVHLCIVGTVGGGRQWQEVDFKHINYNQEVCKELHYLIFLILNIFQKT